jgi:hypothetical protein
MKVAEAKKKVIALFTRAQDEAVKVLDEAGGPDVTSKNEKYDALGKGYDELVATVKDLADKVEAMGGKSKDAPSEAAGGQGEKEVPPAKVGGKGIDEDEDKDKVDDEDEEVVGDEDNSLADRVAKLEAMCKKLMGTGDEDMEEEETGDEDDGEEESEDDDFEESSMTGDTKSRAEILAPGIKKTKDIKVKALQTVYATKDGKKIIEALTGGKKPDFKTQKTVDHLFIAASEVVKATRSDDFKKTKTTDYVPSLRQDDSVVSAEKLNEINAKHYGKK